jgi:hypothetical protein
MCEKETLGEGVAEGGKEALEAELEAASALAFARIFSTLAYSFPSGLVLIVTKTISPSAAP